VVRKQVLRLFFLTMVCALASTSSVTGSSDTSSNSGFSITWSKTYLESGLVSASTVIQTTDGGFLLAGRASTELHGLSQVELVKVDSLGNIAWNKTYEANLGTISKQIIETSDGNYTLAGGYHNNTSGEQFDEGFWLAKINTDGNIIWSKIYKGEDHSYAVSLIQTKDGGYALTGLNNMVPGMGGTRDIWLVKTDLSGNQEWNKTVGNGGVKAIVQTNDDGYALLGSTDDSDYLLIKTTSTGEVQWTKTYGGRDKDYATTVIQTSDGGYALAGGMWLRSNGGGSNLAIVKTDAVGGVQWTQYYGKGTIESMFQTSDGGFALASNPFLKVDVSGNKQWELSLGNLTYVYSGIQTQNGGYAVSGVTNANGARGGWMAVISSTDPSPSNEPTPTVPEFTALAGTLMAILIGVIVVTLARFKTKLIGA
jgi:hypothetical protein